MNKSIFIILAILVLGVGYYFFSANQVATPSDQAGTLLVGSSALYVAEQTPGQSVTVDFAVLEKPGYVAIFESSPEEPGKLLGQSALLTAGETKGITIKLSRATQDGEALYAAIGLDDGDGLFSAALDLEARDPVTDEPVAMVFSVSQDAPTGESAASPLSALREEACPSPGPACPTPQIPECKNGRWLCIGPAEPAN